MMPDHEQQALDPIRKKAQSRVSVRNWHEIYDQGLTLGQRVADQVAAFGGSWKFIGIFLGLMSAWIIANVVMKRPVDPFPFILLNLVLSCVAALQAPVIMMSQNRQSIKDRLDAGNDYEVNRKAEREIEALHLKLDELREQQWAELLELQKRQMDLLERLIAERDRGTAPS